MTTEGKRHLGAVIGSEGYKKSFVETKISTWCDELKNLSKIAWDEPQAAYCAFVSGFKHKLTYIMRTIPGISSCFKKLDETIITDLIPELAGGINVNQPISLPPKNRGLEIQIFD